MKKGNPYTVKFSKAIEELRKEGICEALKEKWVSQFEEETCIDYSKYNLNDRGNGVIRCTFDTVSPPFA